MRAWVWCTGPGRTHTHTHTHTQTHTHTRTHTHTHIVYWFWGTRKMRRLFYILFFVFSFFVYFVTGSGEQERCAASAGRQDVCPSGRCPSRTRGHQPLLSHFLLLPSRGISVKKYFGTNRKRKTTSTLFITNSKKIAWLWYERNIFF